MVDSHPVYGKRLLVSLVADIARDDPDRVIYTIPRDRKTYAKGSQYVTYRDFNRAVDRMAWFIEKNLGKSTTRDTQAYLGPNDLRYFILIVAVPKTGNKLLLTSPRNSLSNHLHLIDKTNCAIFLKSKKTSIDNIVSVAPNPLRIIDIPELEDLLVDGEVAEFPYTFSFEEAKSEPALILHSSGTTGQVKPITFTNRSIASIDEHHYLSNEEGQCTVIGDIPGDSIFVTMPFFHAAAVFLFFGSVYFNYGIILPPPDKPMSLELVLECLETTDPPVSFLAPSLLEEASVSRKALQLIEKQNLVIYGGGGISEKAGAILAKHTRLQNYIGATETGPYPVYPHTDYNNDYDYFKFQPGEPGIQFRHYTADLYELYLIRHDGPQALFIFDTFPDKNEYGTSDLYQPHPTKPGLWKHAGRADDVIVLSNGENVSPLLTETILTETPGVRKVLLYGQKRFEVAALVELDDDAYSLPREVVLDRLTPFLEKANKEGPGHAQLSKDMIIFAAPEKPFSRLPKGTVARKPTFDAFAMEIDEIYSKEIPLHLSDKPLLKDASKEQTVAVLTDIIGRVADLSGMAADQDFFQAGTDSLKVITIVRHLRSQIKAEGANVPPNLVSTGLVYSNPTIAELADALRTLGQGIQTEEHTQKQLDKVEDMLEKYTKNLSHSTQPSMGKRLTVLLTGSTGSLGSYLLNALLAHKRVERIFLLNRSANGRAKQMASSSARGLSTHWGEHVHFLHADLSKPMLGLEEPLYNQMVHSVTHIIHSQWPVNFNIPLATFEPHIRGVRHLIDLAASAPNKPSILFTSSISTVANWCRFNPGLPVPEHEITDVRVASSNGYGASKHISERLLLAAAEKSGVRTLVVRVGQLAGSVDAASVWNKDEWFPSLVASSSYLGVLPSFVGPLSNVDFVPVDRAAKILLDLSMNEDKNAEGRVHFFNLVNPTAVPYKNLAPALQESMKKPSRLVSYSEWVEALKESNKGGQADVQQNPAVKLLDFYESMNNIVPEETELSNDFETTNTQEWSECMRKLEPVKPEWMKAWVRGWDL